MPSSKVLLLSIFAYFASLPVSLDAAKICYRCDDAIYSGKHRWSFASITRCTDVPFERYASRTSRAFGGDHLLCYTRFNDDGVVIKRDAYGFGESYDKNFKCKDRYHVCCQGEFCNKHRTAPCPPMVTPVFKKNVKACYQCIGAEGCKPENLVATEFRTSNAFGGKNLHCFTKFDPTTGMAIVRGAFGMGELFDKQVKCDAKHYLCCYENLCNKQTIGPCVKPSSQDQE